MNREKSRPNQSPGSSFSRSSRPGGKEIPSAAHLPNLERPEAFNAAVDAWLLAIPAAPP